MRFDPGEQICLQLLEVVADFSIGLEDSTRASRHFALQVGHLAVLLCLAIRAFLRHSNQSLVRRLQLPRRIVVIAAINIASHDSSSEFGVLVVRVRPLA
jgi:hypothetical protein